MIQLKRQHKKMLTHQQKLKKSLLQMRFLKPKKNFQPPELIAFIWSSLH